MARAAAPVTAATSSQDSTKEHHTEAEKEKLAQVHVAVFSAQQYVRDFLTEPIKRVFPQTRMLDVKLDEDTAELAHGCLAVIAFVNDDLSKETLVQLAKQGVKLVAMRCAGYDRVDLETAHELGITVVRVPTYSPHSVAEHAVALMFALNRKLYLVHQRTMQGNYSVNGLVGFEMYKKTVGVIGTGAIGYEACRILQGIGCNVLAHDLYPSDKVKALGVPYLPMEELLPKCDIITLHTPLLPSTKHIMNRKALYQSKHGFMLINVSRGGLVQTDALHDALEDGQLGALGMDVYENEGDMFFTDFTASSVKDRMKVWDRKFKSLLVYPQVICTPHSAFLTAEALDSIASTTLDNIARYVLGQPLEPRNVVEFKPPAK